MNPNTSEALEKFRSSLIDCIANLAQLGIDSKEFGKTLVEIPPAIAPKPYFIQLDTDGYGKWMTPSYLLLPDKPPSDYQTEGEALYALEQVRTAWPKEKWRIVHVLPI